MLTKFDWIQFCFILFFWTVVNWYVQCDKIQKLSKKPKVLLFVKYLGQNGYLWNSRIIFLPCFSPFHSSCWWLWFLNHMMCSCFFLKLKNKTYLKCAFFHMIFILNCKIAQTLSESAKLKVLQALIRDRYVIINKYLTLHPQQTNRYERLKI